MNDVFVVVACARELDLTLLGIPFALVGGGVDVEDAMDVVWKVGVDGAGDDLWVGLDDVFGCGVDVSVFYEVDAAYLFGECEV